MGTIGTCHLCGQQKRLTYEHLPAKSSFNRESVEMFGLDSWLGPGRRRLDDRRH
jgi:hypothetical protein